MSMRKATVTAQTTANRVVAAYTDSGMTGGRPPARPFVGGLKSGLHTAPAVGDQILTLYEGVMPHAYPLQAVSTTDTPENLPTLNPGETKIIHPDGRTASGLFNGGISRIFRDSNGVGANISFDRTQLDISVASGNATIDLTDSGIVLFAGSVIPGTITLLTSPSSTGAVNIVSNTFVSRAPQATANLGSLSVGSGTFDGVSAGHFVGVAGALGTIIAANAATGFLGGLIDLQLAGSSKFSVNVSGNALLAGTLGVTGLTTLTGGASLGADLDAATHNLKNVGFISDGATAGTGNWSIDSSGNGLLAGTVGITGLATLTGGVTLGNQIKSGGGGTPGYSTSANTTAGTVIGNDTAGKLSITTNTGPFNANIFYDMGTVNFHDAHGTAPVAVMFTWIYNGSALANVATLGNPNTPPTTSGFKVGLNVIAPGVSGAGTFTCWYFVIW